MDFVLFQVWHSWHLCGAAASYLCWASGNGWIPTGAFKAALHVFQLPFTASTPLVSFLLHAAWSLNSSFVLWLLPAFGLGSLLSSKFPWPFFGTPQGCLLSVLPLQFFCLGCHSLPDLFKSLLQSPSKHPNWLIAPQMHMSSVLFGFLWMLTALFSCLVSPHWDYTGWILSEQASSVEPLAASVTSPRPWSP